MLFHDLRLKLDSLKHTATSGTEFWMARDLVPILGYDAWRRFEEVIDMAQKACESAGAEPTQHFVKTDKKVRAGSGAMVPKSDYYLSRYGCYLVAMNGEPTKPEIGKAQTYFAVQTRIQEVTDELADGTRRRELRGRVKEANKKLGDAAKDAGVQKYALFFDAGYRGLYGMPLADIKKRKGIKAKDDLLDREGRAALAANEFKSTQAELRLRRERVSGDQQAQRVHREVGEQVRATIGRIGGQMPEDLPAEKPIKALKQKVPKSLKEKK